METETIAAIATPIGSSGIGIVRISGSHAREISERLFLPRFKDKNKSQRPLFSTFQSHRLYYGYIQDPENQRIVDEVLLAYMKAPHSYTREDVVEIQSHSGSVILSKILRLVLGGGARLAEPGEFTKRAFLNGRIDLSQAEAIGQMISARTEAGLMISASHLTGELKDSIDGMIDAITEIQLGLEAGIEFSDEVEERPDWDNCIDTLEHEVFARIEGLVKLYDDGHVLRDGIRLGIIGRPNVGKSSLLNRLAKKDKAIVTHIPGTTRDLIEDQISIDGVPVIVTDTAGLHVTEDPIEILGIQKTKDNIKSSDIVLLVIDGAEGFTPDDQKVFEHIEYKNTILVINKIDLISGDKKISIPNRFKSFKRVNVSAKYGQGTEGLISAIKTMCMNDVDIEPGRSLVPNYRQKIALEKALELIENAIKGFRENITEELIADDLVAAKNALGIITGDHLEEDILDEIFGRFCIGK